MKKIVAGFFLIVGIAYFFAFAVAPAGQKEQTIFFCLGLILGLIPHLILFFGSLKREKEKEKEKRKEEEKKALRVFPDNDFFPPKEAD